MSSRGPRLNTRPGSPIVGRCCFHRDTPGPVAAGAPRDLRAKQGNVRLLSRNSLPTCQEPGLREAPPVPPQALPGPAGNTNPRAAAAGDADSTAPEARGAEGSDERVTCLSRRLGRGPRSCDKPLVSFIPGRTQRVFPRVGPRRAPTGVTCDSDGQEPLTGPARPGGLGNDSGAGPAALVLETIAAAQSHVQGPATARLQPNGAGPPSAPLTCTPAAPPPPPAAPLSQTAAANGSHRGGHGLMGHLPRARPFFLDLLTDRTGWASGRLEGSPR